MKNKTFIVIIITLVLMGITAVTGNRPLLCGQQTRQDQQDQQARQSEQAQQDRQAQENQQAGPAAPKQKAGVVFLSPGEDQLWSGEQKISIALKGINPDDVRMVEFYLDGRLIKEFSTPPYTLTYSFGVEGQNHTLKVVVRGEGLKLITDAVLHSYHVDDTQSVEVQQVVAPVVVKDKNGNYVRGLKEQDFIILADDLPLEISYFSSSGKERVNIVQVIDISYSMRNKIHAVLRASKDFTAQLMTDKDKGTFVFFDQRVYDHMGFTGNTDQLIERLDLRAPVMGGTALYDAISYSLNLIRKATGWNLMIVFSDGEDNSSFIDRLSLIQKVKKSPVVIYAIDNRNSGFNDVLKEICTMNGGMLFPLADAAATHKVYDKIREDIKAQYILYFNPAKGGIRGVYKRFHPLTVKVKDRDYEIRTITGYFY